MINSYCVFQGVTKDYFIARDCKFMGRTTPQQFCQKELGGGLSIPACAGGAPEEVVA